MFAAACMAQDAIPTFRSEVSLVRVDVKVTGANGQTVNDLSRDDFVLYDEAERQTISGFETETDRLPLNLVLLLDVSNSMWPALRELSWTTGTALKQLQDHDRVALMLFARGNELAMPFTTDRRAIEQKMAESIYKQTLGSGTALNEALIAAASYLKRDAREGRKAILVVTDNDVQRFGARDDQAQRALDSSDVLVSAVVVGQAARMSNHRYAPPDTGTPDVAFYAKKSGGESIRGGSVGDVFSKVVRAVRTRYGLQFSPTAVEPGKFRKLRVELSEDAKRRHPDAAVQARSGYVAN